MAIDLRNLLPPSDLLDRFAQVEEGLERGRSLGRVGPLGTATSLLLTVIVNAALTDEGALVDRRAALLAVPIPLFLFFWAYAHFWLTESDSPVRYTCTIKPFQPVGNVDGELLSWLPFELVKRLAQRNTRLRFIYPDEDPGEASSQFVEISGQYQVVSRAAANPDDLKTESAETSGAARGNEDRFLEVVAGVRIGKDAPMTLTRRVLEDYVDEAATPEQRLGLIERVYANVATEIYKQIERDVAKKIDLMPVRYRGPALLAEAEDYSRSNTMEAYRRAQTLYRKAIDELSERTSLPSPFGEQLSGWRSLTRSFRRGFARVRAKVPFLRAAEVEWSLKTAQAQIGYCRMVLFRRMLSPLHGRRVEPVFAIPDIAEDVESRLESLRPKSEPAERAVRQALIEAKVTLALAYLSTQRLTEAESYVEAAHRIDPMCLERHATCLFIRAELEAHARSELEMYQRAVNVAFDTRDSVLEVVRFHLAFKTEQLWRRRGVLSDELSRMVLNEYDKVTLHNPANIAGWANAAYVSWLVGDSDAALNSLRQGLNYKEMRRETLVAELDYMLARVHAEGKRFNHAYRHYAAGVVSLIGEGRTSWANQTSFVPYFFDPSNAEIAHRVRRYACDVTLSTRQLSAEVWEEPATADEAGVTQAPTSERVLRSIEAFVLNDWGDSQLWRYHQDGDPIHLENARDAWIEATRRNERFSLPWLSLYKARHFLNENGLQTPEQETARERLNDLQPVWEETRTVNFEDLKDEFVELSRAVMDLDRKVATSEAGVKAMRERLDPGQKSAAKAAPSTGTGAHRVHGAQDSPDHSFESELELETAESDLTALKTELEEAERKRQSKKGKLLSVLRDAVPHEWLWGGERLLLERHPETAVWLRRKSQLDSHHVNMLYDYVDVMVWAQQVRSDESGDALTLRNFLIAEFPSEDLYRMSTALHVDRDFPDQMAERYQQTLDRLILHAEEQNPGMDFFVRRWFPHASQSCRLSLLKKALARPETSRYTIRSALDQLVELFDAHDAGGEFADCLKVSRVGLASDSEHRLWEGRRADVMIGIAAFDDRPLSTVKDNDPNWSSDLRDRIDRITKTNTEAGMPTTTAQRLTLVEIAVESLQQHDPDWTTRLAGRLEQAPPGEEDEARRIDLGILRFTNETLAETHDATPPSNRSRARTVTMDRLRVIRVIERDHGGRVIIDRADPELGPWVAPLALEVDEHILGEVGADGISDIAARIINDDFPEIREQLEEKTDITIPGIRLRAIEDGEGGGRYRVLLQETPIATGSIESAVRVRQSLSAALREAVQSEIVGLLDLDALSNNLQPPQRQALVDSQNPGALLELVCQEHSRQADLQTAAAAALADEGRPAPANRDHSSHPSVSVTGGRKEELQIAFSSELRSAAEEPLWELFVANWEDYRSAYFAESGLRLPNVVITSDLDGGPSSYRITTQGLAPELHIQSEVPGVDHAVGRSGGGSQIADVGGLLDQLSIYVFEDIRAHRSSLIDPGETERLLAILSTYKPFVVSEALECWTLKQIAESLRELVLDGLSIRNLGKILSVLIAHRSSGGDETSRDAAIRVAMKPEIREKLRSLPPESIVHTTPDFDRALRSATPVDAPTLDRITNAVKRVIVVADAECVVTDKDVRRRLRDIAFDSSPRLFVADRTELPSDESFDQSAIELTLW